MINIISIIKKIPFKNTKTKIITIITLIASLIGIYDFIGKSCGIIPFSAENRNFPDCAIPGGVAWTTLNQYDPNSKSFKSSPQFEIVKSKYFYNSVLPRKGDWIELLSNKKLIILDYKTKGIERVFKRPEKLSSIEESDYVDKILKSGCVVEVRDIQVEDVHKGYSIIWILVSNLPNK